MRARFSLIWAFRIEDAMMLPIQTIFPKIRNAPPDKPAFYSVLLWRTPADGTYFLRFETSGRLVSKHNEAERGMVLSELTLFQSSYFPSMIAQAQYLF